VKKTVIGLIAIAIVIILAASGVWYLRDSRKPFVGTPESITIGISPLFDSSSLVYIADDQQYFADNGLNVTIKTYSAGLKAVDGLLNHENDIAVASEFIIVSKAFQDAEILGIGTLARYQNEYIIGSKDRGIEKIEDLAGKKIGIPRGTIAEFYLGRFLELNGILSKDVTIVNIEPSKSADVIGNGTVDAVLVWKPYVDNIIDTMGENIVYWPAQSGQLGYWNAICREDWVTQHPELVTRFLKSMDQAVRYSVYYPTETKEIAKKQLHADDAYIASAWSDTEFSLSLDQSLITAMEDEGRWMIKNNLTNEKTIPDYKDYLYLKGLEEVKPESVNIIG
jgi:NitT/TauT family transport system substrate-binding protein